MLKLLHKQKGFTLIELMIVVAIIGILAAIAIPNFLRFQAKSKQAEAKTNLGAIGTSAESYRVEHDTYVISVTVPALSDLGWAPVGTTRYSYWYAAGAAPGTPAMFPYPVANFSTGAMNDNGCDRTGPPTTVAAATAGTFTAVAMGQIDTDSVCDEWSYTQARALSNDINDVALP